LKGDVVTNGNFSIGWFGALLLLSSSAVLGAGGCGGRSLAAACDPICTCQRCTDDSLKACQEKSEATQQKASDRGCESKIDAYVDCLGDGDNLVCVDQRATADACYPEINALYKCTDGGLPFVDRCTASTNHLAECQGQTVMGGEPTECTRSSACLADCVNTADCDAINEVYGDGALTENGTALLTCTQACISTSG
jgi:hypothetical protein